MLFIVADLTTLRLYLQRARNCGTHVCNALSVLKTETISPDKPLRTCRVFACATTGGMITDVSTVNVPLSPPETPHREVTHYKPELAFLNLQPVNSVLQSLWSGGPGCSTKNTLFRQATPKKSEDLSKVPPEGGKSR